MQGTPTYWLSAVFALRLASWASLDLEGKVTLFPGDLSPTEQCLKFVKQPLALPSHLLMHALLSLLPFCERWEVAKIL